MQLTRFTDYSIRTLMYLAIHPDRLCTVGEVADYYGISQNHLVKLVHNLSQLGHIKSVRGKGGGIQLVKSPEQINLGDLVVQLEPNLTLVECFDPETNTCRIAGSCGLQGILKESLTAFTRTLSGYTLADTIPKPVSFV